jgi:ribosome-associated protein
VLLASVDPAPIIRRTDLRRCTIAIAEQATLNQKKQTGIARQFAIDAARLLADTRCHNVVVLDMRGLSPVTDFMVLATGTSPRQMQTAGDEVQELGEPRGFRSLSRSGDNGHWTCMDLVDVVVHVFSQEARLYYDLDNLWGDARKIAWEADAKVAEQG